MAMKNDKKFEEKFTFQFKINMRNLMNFDPSLTNLHFNGLLLTKLCNPCAKKSLEKLCLIALKIDGKFEGKLTCSF